MFCLVCGLTSQSSEQIGMVFISNSLSIEQIDDLQRIMTSTDNESRQAIPKTDCVDL